jgi:hypothetical protein
MPSPGVLVESSNGLFGTSQLATGAVLEVSTLLALIVYASIGWTLARAAWLILGEGRSGNLASIRTSRMLVG